MCCGRRERGRWGERKEKEEEEEEEGKRGKGRKDRRGRRILMWCCRVGREGGEWGVGEEERGRVEYFVKDFV